MTKICIFSHFGLNIHHSFLCLLPKKGFYNREICLAALLKQNSKTNMTKNREIVIWYFCHTAPTPN